MIDVRERKVLALLAAAWEEWLKIGEKHPDDDEEFHRAIYTAQHVVAFRVARRADPDVWWSPGSDVPAYDPRKAEKPQWIG
jgi:hypothetical protein